VEELGFQLLYRRDWTLPQVAIVGSDETLKMEMQVLEMQVFWYHPLSSRLQLSSPRWGKWCSCSLKEKQRLSRGQEQWEVLDLFAP
jgi:hypothetical protein